ncbi:MAG: mannose-6-phosphate isomerase, class I [Desulfobacterales bacterium]|jgi:mannose-6-phosphate isomerase|nr:mannose-6-phosphate isomerase, class I [Desulfobacterales bacterium]MDP6681490.1 mannose-6-phosphate isomerase, class I [Desulfobacterales bacterium]MDP6808874.1 mannose-6-phosphate isomerase, class I [Desulfobacterales bacterium]|tara:strand:- start:4713 stop:5915 length:1203 start_codon:yes stop_codon:yes gene_type:complete
MKTIGLLKNTVQEYEWGSHTAIPELLGQPASGKPQAELWMGTHPCAPSMVRHQGGWIPLSRLIEKYPQEMLGQSVKKKYQNKLPYLFKVLAAVKPLSLQAHPSIKQAKEGFEKENRLGTPIGAPNRNYKDNNHKPECICALTPFWALNGFRKIHDIIYLLTKICPKGLKEELRELKKYTDPFGLKYFFNALMTMNKKKKNRMIVEALGNAKAFSKKNHIFKWIIKLHSEYPYDMGILSPALLNLIRLKPGQAMFLSEGVLHAHLEGVGIELMANSDNVLRGGLTPKHIDVQELLNVLHFEEIEVTILKPKKINNCERVFLAPAEEFLLSIIEIKKGINFSSPENRSIEIIFCTAGSATIYDVDGDKEVDLFKGTSVVIPSVINKYMINGNATLFKAAVPI